MNDLLRPNPDHEGYHHMHVVIEHLVDDEVLVPVEPDYEAAAVLMAKDQFDLNWDRLAEVEKEAHRIWAKIVVDAAIVRLDDEVG
jgi:hypothetical protein